jgi:hypothetical protein
MVKLSATVAVGVLLFVNPGPAHDSWISEEGAINPVNGAAAARDYRIVMRVPIATAIAP